MKTGCGEAETESKPLGTKLGREGVPHREVPSSHGLGSWSVTLETSPIQVIQDPSPPLVLQLHHSRT